MVLPQLAHFISCLVSISLFQDNLICLRFFVTENPLLLFLSTTLVDLFLASYDTFCLVVEKYVLSGGVVFIDFFVDGFCGFV